MISKGRLGMAASIIVSWVPLPGRCCSVQDHESRDMAWSGKTMIYFIIIASFAPAWPSCRSTGRRPAPKSQVLSGGILQLKMAQLLEQVHGLLLQGLGCMGQLAGKACIAFGVLPKARQCQGGLMQTGILLMQG